MASAPASATSSLTFQRLSGSDRYQTAGVIDQTAFPTGEPTVLLADGVPGHQSDALAASGFAGLYSVGVLLTDNSNSVPSSTLSALKANKVTRVVVVGGTAAVSQAQINELQSDGYTVQTPFQGATRYQTMQMLDNDMAGQVGSDASGNPTAILASGADNHLVDALSAGSLAYSRHFPIILTNSTSSSLQPEAAQVMSRLAIKHLIVAGGTAAIPSAQYSPAPTGVTQVDVEAGKDRSETSKVLADYAITNKWLKATNMDLARGDDGADALAGAPFGGLQGYPTLVTNSPSDVGSAPAFATEHASTLVGTSYVFGGTAAVPASQLGAVQSAGQGPQAPAAPAGTFGTATGTSPVVSAISPTSFTQNNLAYTYSSTDTYQLVQPSSTPGGSASCVADSYAEFQARLSDGDAVSGNYQPAGTSTFCLNDIAPHPPSTVSAATATSGSGVTVTWSAPSTAATDNLSGYSIYRATASSAVPVGGTVPVYTCPAAYTTASGASFQTPPAAPYASVVTVPTSSSSSSYSYTDATATSGNEYCYAVSSQAPDAGGTPQTGTATPANASSVPLTAADPGAVKAA
ncbi:MAG: cell wall-binding repeat-containing protein [Acidimicrobiales bacterium]